MDDIVKEFLVESNENLDQMDRNFVELEKDPTNKDLLSAIFRTIHTIKGTCGFLGFGKLESVAHVGESLLSKLRDGSLTLNPDYTTVLLTMVDAVRQMLSSIEASGAEGDVDYSQLVDNLNKAQRGESLNLNASAVKPEAKAESVPAPDPAPTPTPVAKRDVKLEAPQEAAKEVAKVESPKAEMKAEPTKPEAPKVESVKSEPAKAEVKVEPVKLEVKPEAPKAEAPKSAAAPAAMGGPAGGSVADTAIRVDVGLLDKLMNLVGELVLARNQILQFTARQEDSTFVAASQRLNLITSELQEGVMKTRMQPIGNIWSKFPRVVRDLATICKKKIRLQMEGQETELDKTIIEAIKDPLTHLVRNSVDHGIEMPEDRVAKGKPEEGVIVLRAYHEGGQVNIEISDNGGGINPEKVKQKALQKGLITAEDAARMSDRHLVNLIFLPGFSTAEKVSNISGRGVGMDVVKTNIEKIGGMVDIQSNPGAGTTIKVKIPLTLAIIPALIVTNGGWKYAIPQASLLELVRVENEPGKNKIENIQGAPVYRLRGKLLPLVYLRAQLGDEKTNQDENVNIVVLQADDRHFGLVVDEINDTQEIVVKPVGKQLKGIPVFAGATIMGDGNVALILDIMGIAQRSNLVSELHDRAIQEVANNQNKNVGDSRTMLLFASRDNGRMAVPLSEVARLEKFNNGDIEKAGDQEVIQYRGEIMPLIRVSLVIPERRRVPRDAENIIKSLGDSIQVVVHSKDGKNMGIVIDKVLDIVETHECAQESGSRSGIVGTIVIQDRVTEILDIPQTIQLYNQICQKSSVSEREASYV